MWLIYTLGMAVFQQNPFEGSFENLTTKAAKPVKRAVSDTAKALGADVKQQVMGSGPEPSLVEQTGVKQATAGQQDQIREQQQQQMVDTRQNLARINQEIVQARQARLKREQESRRGEEREKKEKKVEEQRKKEDPMWKKVLRGKMGSRESAQRAGG